MNPSLSVLPSSIRPTLERMHAESDGDMPRIARGFARSLGRKLEPHHLRDAYIAVGREEGRWLYDLVVARSARNVVEFGTSYGVSALWLGAAWRRTGGRVVATELLPEKVAVARANVREAGLEEVVEVLEGDVLETLADHAGPIDVLFFDGWTDRYVALLDLLEPRLAQGCRFVVDNANQGRTQLFLRQMEGRGRWVRTPGPSRRVAVFEWA